jgi:hypothetical protein
MIIELNVTWTFATPPTAPYNMDIYYRPVGTTLYTIVTITNGESGSANITIINNTNDTISDRNLPCSLDYEGYVVPSCAKNDVNERVSFDTVAVDVTDYMQCRGVEAECIAGGIVAILPDPDPSLLFSTDPSITPYIDNFTGAGNSTLLPGISIVWSNPSSPTSTIAQIILSSFDAMAAFDGTTSFNIVGYEGDKVTLLTMTPTIVIACGTNSNIASECYTGDPMPIPFFYPGADNAFTCVNNEVINDYDTTYNSTVVGTVNITEDYSCCQKSACKLYNLVWVGESLMPWITTCQLSFINPNTGELNYVTITSSSGVGQVVAIENSVSIRGGLPNSLDWAAFLSLGGVQIIEVGPCP